MEQIFDDISDNLVCCLYAKCSSDNLYNCVVDPHVVQEMLKLEKQVLQ